MAGDRQRIDFLTLAGILLSMLAVVGGNMLEGGHTGSLVQLTAFVIVFGGTLGATMVQTPLKIFVHGIKRLKWVFLPPKINGKESISKVLLWSNVARREGLLKLQDAADKEADKFTKKSLFLLIDGREPDEIRKILEVELDSRVLFDLNAAKVFEAMGGYSPTVGIIGAVMGLIDVMNNLADPESLGSGIAVAFVATIYGVGFANFFFLPIANKLRMLANDVSQHQEMMIEGIVAIAEGENSAVIHSILEGYHT
jgi:chemotaxis protein MotA